MTARFARWKIWRTHFAQKSDYYVIHFVGSARPAVLERSAVEQARDRIIGNYNVQKEQYVEGGLK